MGTGSSTGQGRNTTYGTRDARRYSAETSYWPELAGAKLAESSGTVRNPHIGASSVGPSSSSTADTCSGAHIGARKSSSLESMDGLPNTTEDSGVVNMGPNSSKSERQVLMKKTMVFEQKTIHFVEEKQHWLKHMDRKVHYWIQVHGS